MALLAAMRTFSSGLLGSMVPGFEQVRMAASHTVMLRFSATVRFPKGFSEYRVRSQTEMLGFFTNTLVPDEVAARLR
jgi:hypothetical protein